MGPCKKHGQQMQVFGINILVTPSCDPQREAPSHDAAAWTENGFRFLCSTRDLRELSPSFSFRQCASITSSFCIYDNCYPQKNNYLPPPLILSNYYFTSPSHPCKLVTGFSGCKICSFITLLVITS